MTPIRWRDRRESLGLLGRRGRGRSAEGERVIEADAGLGKPIHARGH